MATHHIRRKLIAQLDAKLPCYLYGNGFTLGDIMLYLLY